MVDARCLTMRHTCPMAEYRKCDKGHTVYPGTDGQDDWCECKRVAPVGTDVHKLYDRKSKSWCGLPTNQRKAR